jgi:hypothetical protein
MGAIATPTIDDDLLDLANAVLSRLGSMNPAAIA